MRVKKIIPCVCVDHKPDVSDSVYYGMPQLKVSGGFETSTQFCTPFKALNSGFVAIGYILLLFGFVPALAL